MCTRVPRSNVAPMTVTDPALGAPRNWPPRAGVRTRLVRGVIGTERLVDAQARLDDPDDPAPTADWRIEAAIAADFGLLVQAGSGEYQTVTRTVFGDAWAAAFGPGDPSARNEGRWPLPGPGKFEVLFFPLTQQPAFSVFALSGPTVATIRQGGWNRARGFGQPAPNPVTDVEMRSTLHDGTDVSVQSAVGDRVALPALHLSDVKAHRLITERLLTALTDRAAPWRVQLADVDGAPRELLVLDMRSDALPGQIVGPRLLAVGDVDGTQFTIVGDDPDLELALTRIDSDDLRGVTVAAEPGQLSHQAKTREQ